MEKPDITAEDILNYLYKQGGPQSHMYQVNDYIQSTFKYDALALRKLLEDLKEQEYIYIHPDYKLLGDKKAGGKKVDLKTVPVKLQLRLEGFNFMKAERELKRKEERVLEKLTLQNSMSTYKKPVVKAD